MERHEIVFGLVGAIGTDLDILTRALERALLAVGYTSERVRISDILTEIWPDAERGVDSLTRLMNLGDRLRQKTGRDNAAAWLAAARIAARRRQRQSSGSGSGDACATIVRSLKHPDEVRFLRSIYGPRLVVVAAWSTPQERERAVDRRLRRENHNQPAEWYAEQLVKLMNRDQKDAERSHGQRVRDTFELADAYLAVQPGRSVYEPVHRLIRLLFGDPFVTPTRAEQAMFHAWGARLRSSDPGRQVGAVVVDECGETVLTGTNEVPKAGGGQYWTGDTPDHRDFQHGIDMNAQHKAEILKEILGSIKDHHWLAEEYHDTEPEELTRLALQKDGPLARGRIRDLLEFGRVVHAEMAVVTAAARRGTPLRGTSMYTTTYPCHECARLIIAAGIRRVVYTDPYPKSQVPDLYRHEIVNGRATETADCFVTFEPFEGVAPRLFHRVFEAWRRERDDAGQFVPWEPSRSVPRLVAEAEPNAPMELLEERAVRDPAATLGKALTAPQAGTMPAWLIHDSAAAG